MADTAAGTSVNKNISAEDTAGQSAPRVIGPATGPDAARLLVVLALVLTALSYVNTLRFQFVYDDLPQIISNPRVHSWQHAPRLFVEHVWSQFSGQPGNYYRPLFELWLVINYSLFGLHPAWWHATTVAVHLAVTLMVYVLARRVTGDRLTAAIATVIYGLHPTHIETVAWVSGVTEPLLAVFVIGSFVSYVRSRDGGADATWWRAASAASYALAMLCKETGVMVPALLFAYDRLILSRRDGQDETMASMARRYAPYAAAALAYMALRHYVLRGLGYPEAKPWLDVALTLPSFLWFYVRELVWPVGLSVFHDTPLVHTPGLKNFVLPLAGVVATVGALVWVSRRSRVAAFGSWWLAALMVPPIAGIYAFIQEDLVHDRYLYLPSVGFAIVLAWAIRAIKSDGRELFGAPPVPMAITLVLGCALAAGTALQNVYWMNDLILYAHAVNAAPENVVAINHLANEFYKRHRPEDALALYRESLQIKPDDWATHFAVGITMYGLGRFPEAQKELETAVPLLPNNADEYYYLGLAHLEQGNYAQAEPYFRKAIEMFGAKPGFHYALATSLEKQGKLKAAREELREEWKINPEPQVKQDLERVEKLLGGNQ
ncbi:MAG: tetratricopeptide repeat protein [Acidobacteriia bacterium]|nr:tetratricopeptide repeat protein [Terriglobia bacterium]